MDKKCNISADSLVGKSTRVRERQKVKHSANVSHSHTALLASALILASILPTVSVSVYTVQDQRTGNKRILKSRDARGYLGTFRYLGYLPPSGEYPRVTGTYYVIPVRVEVSPCLTHPP